MHLEVKCICFSYDTGFELKDIDFTVAGGERLCLLGPNGSGKTTLSRLLSGFLKPDSGDILIRKRSIYAMKHRERARLISFVPQLKQFEHGIELTDFVLMGAYARDESRSQLEEEAFELLKYLGLHHKTGRPVDSLSSGELQKAVVAQSLLQDAEILVLDEPTAHLDIYWQKEIIEKLIDMTGLKNKTLISILHDINLAFAYFDRALVMDSGRLVYDGTVADDSRLLHIIEKVFRVPLEIYSSGTRKILWYG